MRMERGLVLGIAVLVVLALLPSGAQAVLGALVLAAALLSQVSDRAQATWRRRRTQARVLALDWSVIEGSLAQTRAKPDCERPETLGQCTGRECLVYDSCNFNIKRVGL